MRRIVCALAGIFLPLSASAQRLAPMAEAPSRGSWQAAVDGSREAVRTRMDELGIPGLSVAVGVGDEVIWAEGFGWSDVENQVPVRPSTKFRIASISKSLTAAAVGQLVEEGRLDLDAPIQRYVPGFPEKRWPVTTRLLAGHLAGVRHYRGQEFMSRVQYDDVMDALEVFADDTLLFAPGSEYSYSTYGWNLISAAVQGASGTRFLTYMRDRVLEPAGMRETVAEHADSIIPGRADFYVRDRDALLNAPWVNNSVKWAGGGYLSTAADLVRYGMAYLEPGALMAPETVELLWTSQRTTDGEETGYGIGWSTATRDGHREIWHTGGAMGGSTILMIWPEESVVVAILTNLQSARHVDTARTIAGLFAGAGKTP